MRDLWHDVGAELPIGPRRVAAPEYGSTLYPYIESQPRNAAISRRQPATSSSVAGSAAVRAHAPLAECQLVLRVHERGGAPAVEAIHPTATEDAVATDGGVLLR